MLVWQGEGLQPSEGAWHASTGALSHAGVGRRALSARRAFLLLMAPVVQRWHALHSIAGQMLGCCTLDLPGQSSSNHADLAG